MDAIEDSCSLQFIHHSNILNALLVLASAVRGMPSVLDGHLAEAFISTYLLLFALLLLMFEMNNLRFEEKLRKNYGFLFTYKGRGSFLLLIGLLNLGLSHHSRMAHRYTNCDVSQALQTTFLDT
jgi:hypothetical protein